MTPRITITIIITINIMIITEIRFSSRGGFSNIKPNPTFTLASNKATENHSTFELRLLQLYSLQIREVTNPNDFPIWFDTSSVPRS